MPAKGQTWHATLPARTRCLLAQLIERENMRLSRQGRKALTLNELSKATGVDYRVLKRWAEDKTENYNGGVLALLCSYFDCTPNDLLDPGINTHEVETMDHPDPKKILASSWAGAN